MTSDVDIRQIVLAILRFLPKVHRITYWQRLSNNIILAYYHSATQLNIIHLGLQLMTLCTLPHCECLHHLLSPNIIRIQNDRLRYLCSLHGVDSLF